MKKLMVPIILTFTTTAFASSVIVYNLDDVDAVRANGNTIKIEDIRDGFNLIKGVIVNEDSVSISNNSKVFIILRNTVPKKNFQTSTMAVKSGGDMSGG
ncbi:MAG: hypothetical protein Q7U04_02855 [Bacteriovorax sp.]|nr:hypothetical protein [Bacteriovorax sp.]